MTTGQFEAILNRRLELIRSVLGAKAKEYARGEVDRLHNFRSAACLLNTNLADALWGMAVKHIVSVNDLVSACSVGDVPSLATADEKIGDAINYLILLEAVFDEMRRNDAE